VVPIAAVVVLGGGPLEDVVGALEHGELGAVAADLDAELPKSSSCVGASRIGHAVSVADRGTAAFPAVDG
jgi:hypothetical protein